jgi:hypothetical protein
MVALHVVAIIGPYKISSVMFWTVYVVSELLVSLLVGGPSLRLDNSPQSSLIARAK